jgi:hypothetical protein
MWLAHVTPLRLTPVPTPPFTMSAATMSAVLGPHLWSYANVCDDGA